MRTIAQIIQKEPVESFLQKGMFDPIYFIENVFGIELAWFHKEWINLVRKNRFVCITASRGTSKTTVLGIWYPLWYCWYKRNKNIMVVANSLEQSTRIMDLIRETIEDNELLKELIPNDRSVTWKKSEINTTTKCKIFLRALTENIRGVRNDYCLSDEVGQYEDIEMFRRVIEPTVDLRKGTMVGIGCVRGDTIIATTEGYARIEKLPFQKKLCEYNRPIYGINGFNEATHLFDNGVSKTILIKTNCGLEIECTPNHPLINSELSWKEAKEYNTGDYLPVMIGANIFGSKNINPDFAYLMGLAIADGSFERRSRLTNRITITKKEKNIQKYLISKGFHSLDGIHFRKSWKEFIDFLLDEEYNFKTALQKSIPDNTFRWNKESTIWLLRGLFDGDGVMALGKRGPKVSYSTGSKELAKKVQFLLLNLGIFSSLITNKRKPDIRPEFKNSNPINYSVSICCDHLYQFKELIGFTHNSIKLEKSKRIRILTGTLIPDISKTLKENIAIPKKIFPNINIIYHANKYNRPISRNYINQRKKLFSKESQKEIESRLKYYYTKITEITYSQCHTYDFVIPQTHSFFSNGFISHNTPRSPTDLLSVLSKNKLYISRVYKLYDKGRSIWPEMYSKGDLEAIKLRIGEAAFASEYECNANAEVENAIFPSELVASCFDFNRKFNAEETEGGIRILSADFAIAKGPTADFDAFIVVEKVAGVGVIKHGERHRGLSIAGKTSRIRELYEMHRCEAIYIDPSNVGAAVGEELRSLGYPVYNAEMHSQARNHLIINLRRMMENKQLIIPRDMEDMATFNFSQILVSELLGFKQAKSKFTDTLQLRSTSPHDDLAISLAIACKGISNKKEFVDMMAM